MSLLGPVRARVDGAPLDLGGTKQRAVFALLAMQPGRVVAMDRLIDDLWHEDPPAQATVTLRAYISRLRRVLEEAGEVRIRTQPPGWVLDLNPEDVDLIDFHARLATVRAQLADEHHDPPPTDLYAACEQLVVALGLWNGEALADLQSLGVAREEATRAEDARSAAIELLLETRLRLGQHEQVVEDAGPFIDANPFRERAWAALILALYRSGRQSDAVAAVARLREILLDELGLDPSPSIRDLEVQVLRQDPALLRPRPPPARVIPDVDAAEPASAVAPDEPHVFGHERTLRLLAECVAESHQGRGRLLVLEAEAGAGKTTMLQVLARRVEASGGRVVHAGGGGAGAMPALWSWVTVVRALSSEDVTAADSSSGPEPIDTARALMLAAPHDRHEERGTVTLSRTALYRGVIELLAAAHRRARLAVVFDDLQWVDDETLTLLSLAVDELGSQGVLFAVGVRTDEPAAPQVLSTLMRMPRHLLTRHHLDGLDPRSVAGLVSRTTHEAPDEDLVTALHATTAGNPLFVTELVRLLAAERRLDLHGVATTLPERVHDVLRRRIERLPAESVALMQIVAMARSAIDVEILSSVTGQDADRVIDDVEAALIAGLLVEHPDGSSLAPSHDLVRQALLVDLSGARRVRLHARLAAALQARGPLGPERVLEVADHLTAAAPAVGPAAAIPYLLTASEDAISRYATRTAARILEEALTLATRISDPAARFENEHRVRGRLALVRAYLGSDPQPPENRLPPPPPLDDANLSSWVGTVTMAAAAGELVWARDAAEAALLAPLFPRGQVVAQFATGWISAALGDIDRAERSLVRVLQLAEEGAAEGTTGLIGPTRETASGWLSMIKHVRGKDDVARSILQGARQASVSEIGSVNLALHECMFAAMQGDAETAHTHASRMLALAERLEYSVFVSHAEIFDAWALAVLAEHPDATELQTALAAYRRSGLVIFEPTFDILLAEVHELAGDDDAARAAVETSRALTGRTGEVIYGPRLEALARRLVPIQT